MVDAHVKCYTINLWVKYMTGAIQASFVSSLKNTQASFAP